MQMKEDVQLVGVTQHDVIDILKIHLSRVIFNKMLMLDLGCLFSILI